MMNRRHFWVLGIGVVLGLSVPLRAESPVDGACHDQGSGCAPPAGRDSPAGGPPAVMSSTAPASWQTEMTQAQSAGDACKADIEKFCDGVQVGEGRLEKCLKAHKKKLSKTCRTTLK
jgi:hypothetical protein